MSPEFDPEITRYTVWTGDGTASILLTPTPIDAGATITVNGAPPGAPLALIGLGLLVDIVVTPPDGSTPITYTIEVVRVTTRDLIDPTPRAGDRFGNSVAVLRNGNIVVTDPYDWTGAIQAGAVHLYNPRVSVIPFASLHGDSPAGLMGLRGITVLANDNFVVYSPGGADSLGTVQLIDGSAGTQIGPTLTSGLADDFDTIRVVALVNGNYVVTTREEDVGGLVDAGSVRLMSGANGTQIGAMLAGDVARDGMGTDGVHALANGNYVVLTPSDDENGVVDAGSARLMSGTTGAPIGPGLVGETPDDLCTTSFAALENGNFVIAAQGDDEGGVVEAGAVRLFSSNTGAQIGATLFGDTEGDHLGGYQQIVALKNGNYVIGSPEDDVNGIVDAGSVRLISGATGAQIGPALVGAAADDHLGQRRGTIAIGNGNFAVAFVSDDVGGIANTGSVRLFNGTTGAQFGAALAGDQADDRLGSGGLLALGNGNFAVVSYEDDVRGVVDAGSARLVNGTTGLQIGPPLVGSAVGTPFGQGSRATALANGNYVVVSSFADVGGVSDAGSVRLVSGTLGVQIGPTLAGDVEDDRLGDWTTNALGNGNFIVRSSRDDEGGVVDAGSVRLVSGVTGAQLGTTLSGTNANDLQRTWLAAPSHGGFFVLGFGLWDNGSVDSGRVRLIAE